ncbi:DUF222 domain-containing protein [Microbacterium fluvii]|uniref:DUF222 domain-containing protein n=1 Tax=Microbacterium fluvii TaxID=415215 RepID=A0ABW2HHQ0_9MICO|nr:HNH endonuclease signature motif containing protein [Microbacterium fluvii]MCU4673594.1 HNH endonuclease [Microbacterium fluvii]
MNELLDRIDALSAELDGVLAEAFSGAVGAATDDDVLAIMGAAAGIARRAEALLCEGSGVVSQRSTDEIVADRMSARFGSVTAGELVQRVTRSTRVTANAYVRIGRLTAPRRALTGEALPARYPGLREALATGAVGVEGALAVAVPLEKARPAAGDAAVLVAEAELCTAARGDAPDAPPVVDADALREMAQVWAVFLDQDGTEPPEERAMRKRDFWIGRCRDGVVPFGGHALPEFMAELRRCIDALMSPRTARQPDGPWFAGGESGAGTELESTGSGEGGEGEGDSSGDEAAPPLDPRTVGQRRHDALWTLIHRIATSGTLPTIAGAAPTLVVHAREKDLLAGTGFTHLPGIGEPQPIDLAERIACTGRMQRVVFAENGRITSIRTTERLFNRRQRRAIEARDGTCIIPGCQVPADWCEIHHVDEHSEGGETSTDNGVPVCMFHHHWVHVCGWEIQMRLGVPYVRGPAWWDPRRRWFRASKSPLTMLDRLEIRQPLAHSRHLTLTT